LGEGGEFFKLMHGNRAHSELEQDVLVNDEGVDPRSKDKSLFGHCILGEETPDTESTSGCVPDDNDPQKCRTVPGNCSCPAFSTKNVS
jgi:hypothetical protein